MNNMNNARKSRKAQEAEDDDDEEEEEYADEKQQNSSSGGIFNTFAGLFGMGGKGTQSDGRPDPNKMFGDVFEDM